MQRLRRTAVTVGVAVLASLLVAVVIPGGSSAHGGAKRVDSKIKTIQGYSDGESLAIFGLLSAGSSKCVEGRTIVIKVLFSNGHKPIKLDVAHSSRSGGWLGITTMKAIEEAGIGPAAARAKLKKRVIRSKGGKIVCGGDQATYRFA